MSKIYCPKCGKEITDKEQICPCCKPAWLNEDLNTKTENSGVPKPNIVFLIQGIVFLIIAIGLCIFGLMEFSTETGGIIGIISVVFGIFLGIIGVASYNEYADEVYKCDLAKTDYTAYQEYIENERQKRIAEQERLQKQKEEQEAKKFNYYRYKCPMCGSNKIANISTGKKVVSTEMLGLASNKIGKTYQCDDCKYMW